MTKLYKTSQELDPQPFFTLPLPDDTLPDVSSVALFDQNGYAVTDLELQYYTLSGTDLEAYRINHQTDKSYKKRWFFQDNVHTGAGLNHAWLFQRKAFEGQALEQIQGWAQTHPIFYKLIKLKPKWGIDFSMDYYDDSGAVFEVLHFEWDSFNYQEVLNVKGQVETKLLAVDWNDAAKSIYQRRSEWHHLDFFAQSRWKTDYFNLVPEQFKMVAWA